jgi:hypothetical protein
MYVYVCFSSVEAYNKLLLKIYLLINNSNTRQDILILDIKNYIVDGKSKSPMYYKNNYCKMNFMSLCPKQKIQ